MKILVIGGGGREHALVWRLAQNPTVDRLFAAPGNAGIEEEAHCLPVAADDVRALVEFVETEDIDLTVVGPEAPLVAGLADELMARGFRVFGPGREAARIEGSKAWAKELCENHGVPTARSRLFTSFPDAVEYLDEIEPPFVIKADGLAAGKGVTVTEDRAAAEDALRAALVDRAFGEAGDRVLVEEYLEGQEVSAFALTDGRDVLPLVLAQDFKRVGDGNRGPNTGGMGAYSPVPFVDDVTARRIWIDVVERVVRAMDVDGVRFLGVLYAGLMLTADGPKVLEFNCRFGDPEAQVVIPRLRSDLAELFLACVEGNLGLYKTIWTPDACVTIVLASGGYPGEYETGMQIRGLDAAREVDQTLVFHSGTERRGGRVVTAGGRVLAVSSLGATISEARARAYDAASQISFQGMHYRKDIAERVAEEAT